MNVVLLGKRQPNVRSLFAQNEQGLAIDIGDRNGASEAKRTWRRNLLLNTEVFSDTAWVKTATTITPNTTTNPIDGTTTADTLTETAAASAHNITRTTAIEQGLVYTYSVYAKTNGRVLQFVTPSAVVSSGFANFDLVNGVVGDKSAGVTQAMTSLGDGWYRCAITFTAAAGGSQTFNLALVTSAASFRGSSYLGDGTSGIFIVGAQFEQAAAASTYQKITDFNTEFKQAYPAHSLYVDSTGIAPAVYPGDQVGLVIDSSRGGLEGLSAELLPNTTFDNDTGWTTTEGASPPTISGGTINWSGSTGGRTSTVSLVVGKCYCLEYDIVSYTSGTVQLRDGTNNISMATTGAVPSRQKRIFIAAGTQIRLTSFASATAVFDNVSIREVPGNHAYQTASSSRPALARTPDGGRRNLLTGTDAMATQSLTVLAVQHTLSFQGTGTVTLSGVSTSGPLVGTGAADIVSLTFTPTAGSLTLTVTGTVQLAQLETGASRTAYQKVGLTSDVTESGKRDCWGLLADGSDDSLITSSVNFSSTDKMTVMAGVRKNSDAVTIISELTANAVTNNGAFTLYTNTAGLGWASKGTTLVDSVNFSGASSPIGLVLTGQGNISAPASSLRANGVEILSSTSSQGSGNFSNAVLYIGSRGGSANRFNGILYTLIVRGAATPTGTIADFEKNLLRIRAGLGPF